MKHLLILSLFLVGCAKASPNTSTPNSQIETPQEEISNCEVLEKYAVLEWNDNSERFTWVYLCDVKGEPCIVFEDTKTYEVEVHCEINEWP